jgi:hypothetical protein
MPPDYGGTALVVKNTEDKNEQAKAQDVIPSDMRPRRTLISRPTPPVLPPISAPFGISGQEDAKEISSEHKQDNEAIINESPAELTPNPTLFSPETLKSDDLLLLGIALMLLYDKGEGNDIPLDALLILAMIYLSGL